MNKKYSLYILGVALSTLMLVSCSKKDIKTTDILSDSVKTTLSTEQLSLVERVTELENSIEILRDTNYELELELAYLNLKLDNLFSSNNNTEENNNNDENIDDDVMFYNIQVRPFIEKIKDKMSSDRALEIGYEIDNKTGKTITSLVCEVTIDFKDFDDVMATDFIHFNDVNIKHGRNLFVLKSFDLGGFIDDGLLTSLDIEKMNKNTDSLEITLIPTKVVFSDGTMLTQ